MDQELANLLTYYAEERDVGFDSDDPDQVWIYDADLGLQEFDKETLEQQFASFADVQRAKKREEESKRLDTPSTERIWQRLDQGTSAFDYTPDTVMVK